MKIAGYTKFREFSTWVNETQGFLLLTGDEHAVLPEYINVVERCRQEFLTTYPAYEIEPLGVLQ